MQQYFPKMNAISLVHNSSKGILGCTKKGNNIEKIKKEIQILTQPIMFPPTPCVNPSRLQVPLKMRDL